MKGVIEPIVNGRAIKHYRAFTSLETGLATPRDPAYKGAVINGYTPDDFVVDTSLIVYLPLYRLKGNTIKTVDRYANSCTVTGALWRPQGRYFDGSDDRIDCGAIGTVTSGLTVIIWAKRRSDWTGLTKVVLTRDAAYRIFNVSNKMACRFATVNNAWASTLVTGSQDWTLNSYDCAAFIYNGATGKIYRNGTEIGTINATGNITGYEANLTIGARASGASPADVDVGEVWIYNRGISTAELSHNYNVTRWRYQ